jgi:hypothetical protein
LSEGEKHDAKPDLPDPTGLANAPTAAETMRAKIVREARIVEGE